MTRQCASQAYWSGACGTFPATLWQQFGSPLPCRYRGRRACDTRLAPGHMYCTRPPSRGCARCVCGTPFRREPEMCSLLLCTAALWASHKGRLGSLVQVICRCRVCVAVCRKVNYPRYQYAPPHNKTNCCPKVATSHHRAKAWVGQSTALLPGAVHSGPARCSGPSI